MDQTPQTTRLSFLSAQRPIFYFLLLWFVFTYFLWLNNTPYFPDPDSFYHAQIVELIRDTGPVKDFVWLPLTTLKDIFIDHHFLYHLIIIPLTFFCSSLLAVKLAAIFLAALFMVVFQWLLDRLAIKYSLVYTLVLLFSDQFIFRLNLAKAPSVSLIFLLLAVYFIHRFEHRWSWPLFALSFSYVWLYGGWPILLGMGIIYFIIAGVSQLLADIKKQAISNQQSAIKNIGQKLKLFFSQLFSWSTLKLPFSIFSGLFAGLIINPYFPQNLQFYWQQTFQIGLVNYRDIVSVGGEWYPMSFSNLIAHNIYALILFFVALVLFFVFLKKQSALSWLFCLLSLIFFWLVLKSQRNIEYFIPFALIFSALVFTPLLASASQSKNLIARLFADYRWGVILVLVCLVACLPITFSYNFFNLKQSLRGGFPWTKFSAAGSWLRNNTAQGALIFHDNWADFPVLFYRDPEARYLVGLDPTFLYFQNAEQYFFWRDITLGKKSGYLCQQIKERFQADYIFIGQPGQAFDSKLASDRDCAKVYQDAEANIYRLN